MPDSRGKSLLEMADSRRRPRPGRLKTCYTMSEPPMISESTSEITVTDETAELGMMCFNMMRRSERPWLLAVLTKSP